MRHVVIIEDAQEIASLLDLVLRANTTSRTTIICSEFDQIIDAIDWQHVDVVICDQHLDDYDGKVILQYLAEHWPAVHRILITADSDTQDDQWFVDKVFIKPVTPGLLVQAVEGTS